jgi:hypothetical protein
VGRGRGGTTPARRPVGATRARLAERRGANIAKVAAARKLLTLVYWATRREHLLPDQTSVSTNPAQPGREVVACLTSAYGGEVDLT